MTYNIEHIDGIGPREREQLVSVGITTTDDVLAKCSTAESIREMAERTSISELRLQSWKNQADLMRVSGIGTTYGQLLEASGVESVEALSQRVPENIVNLLDRVNTEKRYARSTPPLRTVQQWVERAQTLQESGERKTRAESRAKLSMTIAREVPSFPTPVRALLPS